VKLITFTVIIIVNFEMVEQNNAQLLAEIKKLEASAK
jgi:hypothetical protein